MPEAGRPTVESGNSYHDVAVVHRLLDMLLGVEIVEVWPEAIEPVDDIRLQLATGGAAFIQVKEVSPGARWTVATLDSEGIFGAFLEQHRRQPASKLILHTGSSARDLREVADRARNALANHADLEGAVAEWEARLRGHLKFIEGTQARTGLTRADALRFFAAILVEDSQGTVAQRRSRAVERLSQLVDNPAEALTHLEGLARASAAQRLKIDQKRVVDVLTDAGLPVSTSAIRTPPDFAAYARQLGEVAAALNTADLPPLDLSIEIEGTRVSAIAESLPPRLLLVGGHGSGKSRLATSSAQAWLLEGRPGLHVRLSRWATDLERLLEAELASVAGRSAGRGEVRRHFASERSFLILDGLDEIPSELRSLAVRQIVELSAQFPNLQMLLTSRPTDTRLPGWSHGRLLELTDDQVTSVVTTDAWRWQWPASVAALAHNPMMLGILSPLARAGVHLPLTEPLVLSEFVSVLIDREAARDDHNAVTIRLVLEEAANQWLRNGSVAMPPVEFRSLCAGVAVSMRSEGYATLDADGIESRLRSVGLAIRLQDGAFIPLHRAVLDHLAGMSLLRHDPTEAVSTPNLREAVAHFVGTRASVDEALVACLDTASRSDLELLARCRRMAKDDLAWHRSASDFGRTYVSAVRLLQEHQLPGVPLLPGHVEVRLDTGLTWISEIATDSEDSITVVEKPEMTTMSVGDGPPIPVQVVRGAGFTGRMITSGVPHFVGYDRIAEALSEAIDKHLFPDEGPDLVYERLVGVLARVEAVFNIRSAGVPAGFRRAELALVTPRVLLERVSAFVSQLTGGAPVDLRQSLFAFAPPNTVGLLTDAPPADEDLRDPAGHRSGLAFHCASLVTLLAEAERFGIADLPLHPLGLRPSSPDDPILGLPPRIHLLAGDDLTAYVGAFEVARLRAFRHLVEKNLPGLARAMPKYQSLPWRLTATVVRDEKTPNIFDATTYYRHMRAEGPGDEVTVASSLEPPGFDEQDGFSAIWTGRSLLDRTYQMVASDTRDLLAGRYSLGRSAL